MSACWGRMLAAVGSIALTALLTGCGGDEVSNQMSQMSPQQARAQVIDTGKGLVRDLGLQGNLVETRFSYDSCTDDNKGPFRGKLLMLFWWPGASRSGPADPATVYTTLQQHGWQSDSDFHSHGMTLTKNDVDAEVNVVDSAGPPPAGHVGITLYGQCRDTYDHSKDPFDRGDVTAELQSQ